MRNIRIISLGLFIIFAGALWANVQTVKIEKETTDFSLNIKYPHGYSEPVDATIKTLVTDTQKTADERAASNDLPADIPGKNGLTIDFNTKYQTPRALSILFDISIYVRGAAHPDNSVKVLNFIDNVDVSLEQLFKPGSHYLTEIAAECRSHLLKKKDADANWVVTGTNPVKDNYKNWYFSKDGLVIVFDTYQVAAYVYGPQTVTIPKSLLKKWLRPEVEKAVWGNA
ncbi:MAG: RsiV family protein [Legionella sp.]|nr:RsiV family protein [Legionella sp.]